MPFLDPVDERPSFVAEADLEGSVGSGSDLGRRRWFRRIA